jgi:tetratricopeptide (TPR) repeat protein
MLEPALAGQQSNLTRRHSENVQAYELYLKGQRLWEKRGESNLRAALECFRTALELDPEYALAYAGIADCYSILGVYGNAFFIHGLTGLSLSVAGLQEAAIRYARRALELQPNFILGLWALHKTMTFTGRWDESIAAAEKMVTLVRREATHVGQLGMAYGLSGQQEKALALRQELHQRRENGEYVTPAALLAIDVGLVDQQAARDDLIACIEDGGNGFGAAVMLGPLFHSVAQYPSCTDVWARMGLNQV